MKTTILVVVLVVCAVGFTFGSEPSITKLTGNPTTTFLHTEAHSKRREVSHRHIDLKAKRFSTLETAEFHSDAGFHEYKKGGSNKWPRINLNSNDNEMHPFLIHFGKTDYMHPASKKAIEDRINQIGGCAVHSEDGVFRFDVDSQYVPYNSYVVFCTEASMQTLSAESNDASWIGAWLPEYKSAAPASSESNRVVVHILGSSAANLLPQLTESVHSLVSSELTLSVIKKSVILIEIPEDLKDREETLNKLYSFLSHQSYVHFIENQHPVKSMNQNAAWSTQSGAKNVFPSYDNSLTGAGQIIGVADSGLDYDNCFFRDTIPVPLGAFNPSHRKIVSYRKTSLAAYGDGVKGHGTHVCGSIAGSLTTNIPKLNIGRGIAYNAKISLLGMSAPGGDFLDAPPSLDNSDFFATPYAQGARIHSNSWGCSNPNPYLCNNYDSRAQDVDDYVYHNPNLLVVFAAGNTGFYGYNTVTSPGTCKNCLTVGASYSSKVSFKNITKYFDDLYFVNHECCNGPPSNCPGECPANLKECCSKGYEMCCTKLQKEAFSNSLYNFVNLADFSSRGPAGLLSKRMKPDVVAPGSYIVSAYSDGNLNSNNCGTNKPADGNNAALVANRGTSMATPVVSGTAALIREYFQKLQTPVQPSAALMKAVFVASAVPLTGYYYEEGEFFKNGPAPQFEYGFGTIRTARVLPFAASASKSYYVDNISIATGGVKNFTINVTKGQKIFNAVLAWTDPPATVGANEALVNDLDLIVVSPSGKEYHGNIAGVYLQLPYIYDGYNNVEKVAAPAEVGDWTVSIEAYSVTVGSPQTYSVFINVQGAVTTACANSCKTKCSSITNNKKKKKCQKKCKKETCF